MIGTTANSRGRLSKKTRTAILRCCPDITVACRHSDSRRAAWPALQPSASGQSHAPAYYLLAASAGSKPALTRRALPEIVATLSLELRVSAVLFLSPLDQRLAAPADNAHRDHRASSHLRAGNIFWPHRNSAPAWP